MKWIFFGAAAVALCGCSVTRLTVPIHPAEDRARAEAINRALAGRPAVVTLRDDDGNLEKVPVRAIQFDGDTVAFAKVEVVGAETGAINFADWTTVPVSKVVEIDALDRERGAVKGLLIGAAAGFVPSALAGAFDFHSAFQCANSGIEGSTGGASSCQEPSFGASLLVGAILGLGVAALTGALGAAVGYSVGEGASITAAPGAPSASVASRP
jgi:hypothetical protein